MLFGSRNANGISSSMCGGYKYRMVKNQEASEAKKRDSSARPQVQCCPQTHVRSYGSVRSVGNDAGTDIGSVPVGQLRSRSKASSSSSCRCCCSLRCEYDVAKSGAGSSS